MPPPLESGYHPLNLPTPTPPSSWPTGLIVGLIMFVIIIIIIFAAIASFPTTPPSLPGSGSVVVSQVVVQSSDDVCGLNGVTQMGFTVSSGASQPLFWVANAPYLPCTISSGDANTPGFQVLASFPIFVNSSAQLISVSVLCPASYSGPLTLVFN
jgi:hypothetical protein